MSVNDCVCCKAGTAGLVGTFVIDQDGKSGTVVNAFDSWAFTLEIELARWRMNGDGRVKVYLPVRHVRLK